MAFKLELNYDIADALTLLNLKNCLKQTKKQVKQHLKKGAYMHPEDLEHNQKLIPALEVVIHYYGG
jgi:hypothetical protein